MEALAGNPHVTAEDITEIVRNKLGSISRQAVYDTLGVFVEKNLLRRIQPAGSIARYEDRVGDNHHHLVCRGCDLMYDDGLRARVDRMDEAEVVHWGLCPACQT